MTAEDLLEITKAIERMNGNIGLTKAKKLLDAYNDVVGHLTTTLNENDNLKNEVTYWKHRVVSDYLGEET
jgi:hypothetical protein